MAAQMWATTQLVWRPLAMVAPLWHAAALDLARRCSSWASTFSSFDDPVAQVLLAMGVNLAVGPGDNRGRAQS